MFLTNLIVNIRVFFFSIKHFKPIIKEQLVIGNTFLRLCLECLLIWRVYYPRTKFEYEAEKLLIEGVKFPSDINYFKKFETYLKNPKTNYSSLQSLQIESNDSPDNLFEGIQSMGDVLRKIDKGIQEFEAVQTEFQRILNYCSVNIANNPQIAKSIQKIQESYKKVFKIMETAMHSNLDEKIYNSYMNKLFDYEEFCEEVMEDFKEISKKTMKDEYFLAKYRGMIQSRYIYNKLDIQNKFN